jgi:hypothetical protein
MRRETHDGIQFTSIFRYRQLGGLNLVNVWSAARLQGKSLWMKESLRQCIRPVCGEFVLLAMMRYAAYLSYKTPRLGKSHLTNQVSGTPL